MLFTRFWQKQTSVWGPTPDNFCHFYNGKVLTGGNVYKDSLCVREAGRMAQVSIKTSAQQKYNQSTLLKVLGLSPLKIF